MFSLKLGRTLLTKESKKASDACICIRNFVSSSHQLQKSDQRAVVSPETGREVTKSGKVKDLIANETRVDRCSLYPDHIEWLDDRLVRISKPTKNVMQSGTSYTNSWKIEFDSQPRGEYWLMGWTSTQDALSNSTLTFPTKEAAIVYCEKNKLQWFLEEQPERKVRRKSYADNFSWSKRTRLGSK